MTTIHTPHGEVSAVQTVGGYDLLINGKTVAYADKRAGIWRVYGRSFMTIQRAAEYVAKTYEPAPEPADFENEVDADFLEERVLDACEIGNHLADEQAQNDCETYCAMQYEQELERVEFWRKYYSENPPQVPAKTITGLPDGTAKVVLNTGEIRLIPAQIFTPKQEPK